MSASGGAGRGQRLRSNRKQGFGPSGEAIVDAVVTRYPAAFDTQEREEQRTARGALRHDARTANPALPFSWVASPPSLRRPPLSRVATGEEVGG